MNIKHDDIKITKSSQNYISNKILKTHTPKHIYVINTFIMHINSHHYLINGIYTLTHRQTHIQGLSTFSGLIFSQG